MCQRCLEIEIDGFADMNEYEVFNLKFQSLIEAKVLLMIKDFQNHSIFDYSIYECTFCKQKWCLSLPSETFWRGFYLREDHTKKKINQMETRDKQKSRLGFILVFVLIVVSLIYFLI